MRTANKNEVRSRLYDDVRMFLPRATSFGILAGPTPRTEIDTIRLRFYRPQIVAFDIDESAVLAARACNVEAVCSNVRYAAPFEGRSIDFFNLDLFRTLTTERPVIENAAKYARLGLAVFVSYDGRNREDVISMETTKDEERVTTPETTNRCERVIAAETTSSRERVTFAETPKDAERVIAAELTKSRERVMRRETATHAERVTAHKTTSPEERVTDNETTNKQELVTAERVTGSETTIPKERLTVEQSARVTMLDNIIRAVRPEAKLARVYAYRGKGQVGVPMVGALFIFTKRVVETLPAFLPAYENHTVEREFRLRGIGVKGEQLKKKLKNGRMSSRRRQPES